MAKKQLKGTNFRLSEDFPQEIRDRRTKLLPVMFAARNAGHKAYLVVDKLHIEYKDNGGHRIYDTNTIFSLPGDLHPHHISSRRTRDCLVFFTDLNPLSNFHKCNLEIDGHKYFSVEQYYQLQKAEFAHDDSAAARILQATTSLQCKLAGDRVKINRNADWDHQKTIVMRKALQHKIAQNPSVKEYLRTTGDRQLGEASPKDLFWGIGHSLKERECTNYIGWPGQNKLGTLLTELRATL
jgi:ribA/ribD-fused uncharacterized protein